MDSGIGGVLPVDILFRRGLTGQQPSFEDFATKCVTSPSMPAGIRNLPPDLDVIRRGEVRSELQLVARKDQLFLGYRLDLCISASTNPKTNSDLITRVI
jgi:hypothetical protein